MANTPSPVSRLMAEALAGRLSRREITRRAAALGVSAPLAGMMLRANAAAVGAQEASPAAGDAIPVPAGLRTDLSGATIAAVLSDPTDPNGEFVERAIATFGEATGITVNFLRGETQTDQRLQSYRQQFAGQSSDIDVFQIDVIWPGVVAEHALDLNESLGEEAQQHFPAIVENNTVDGALVGLPWFTDAGLLYFRNDLLQKYELQPPQTWEELTQAAQTIQDGERAANPSFVGFVWQGRAYEGLTCNGLEWQASFGGGEIIDAEGNVTINNPQAIAAFEQAAGWVGTISPQDVTTFREAETINVWSAGNAAFMRNWPYGYSVSQEVPALAGQVGVSPLPTGTGEGARNAATLGGWQLMVSRYSQNPDAAIEFVRFMCSPEVQTAFAVQRSMLPTIPTVYEEPAVAEASEFIPRLLPVFQNAVARPSSAAADLYPEISAVYYNELNQVLTGQTSAADAVASMEEEMNAILQDL
ncbi:MAG TPA: ABC transporter substrate-binding protein [Thermomicrobiales bacterium]|nr:ABC transporter substrate-binding protein [Thermomicrobiales bacterium]